MSSPTGEPATGERLEARHGKEIERLEQAIAQSDAAEPLSRAEALRRRAVVETQLRELDLAEREGDVVRIEEIRALLVSAFLVVRERILYAPGKIAPELAAESNLATCQEIVDSELREALTEIADSSADAMIHQATAETKRRAGGSR
jgi:hypothetical protein